MRASRVVTCTIATAIAAMGCREQTTPMVAGGLPDEALAAVRTGGHVAGPPFPAPVVRNPFEGDDPALAEGRRLFLWYNCGGCHGIEGGGGMGPPLADAEWIYGGEPNNVFQTIVQGRPNGMPAYSTLADDHVWKLVLRVRELGKLSDPRAGRAGRGDDGSPRQGQAGAQQQGRVP